MPEAYPISVTSLGSDSTYLSNQMCDSLIIVSTYVVHRQAVRIHFPVKCLRQSSSALGLSLGALGQVWVEG